MICNQQFHRKVPSSPSAMPKMARVSAVVGVGAREVGEDARLASPA